jgi:hypothetical protein
VPTPSNHPVQPSPPEQPSIPPIVPVADDSPPIMPRRDKDSDSDDDDDGDEVGVDQGPSPVTTRSDRRVRPPNRMNLNTMKVKELNAKKTNNAQELRKKLSSQKVRAGVLNHKFISSVEWTQLKICMLTGKFGKLLGNLYQENDHEVDTVENLDPSIFAAKANSEDTPTYEEAMNGALADDFRKSMELEWDMLNVVMKDWYIVERQPWMNVMPSTWSIRCKRFTDGLTRKLKARLCVRGEKQMEGIDFLETFARVFNWKTVRIMLIISLIYDFATLQVDYAAAFTQSDIDKPTNWESMEEKEKERSGVYLVYTLSYPKVSNNLGRFSDSRNHFTV